MASVPQCLGRCKVLTERVLRTFVLLYASVQGRFVNSHCLMGVRTVLSGMLCVYRSKADCRPSRTSSSSSAALGRQSKTLQTDVHTVVKTSRSSLMTTCLRSLTNATTQSPSTFTTISILHHRPLIIIIISSSSSSSIVIGVICCGVQGVPVPPLFGLGVACPHFLGLNR